ncbi:MAG: hypothetical protein K8F27_01960 [Sulfuricellaceae bacterium]|nr:hypothetical protein [Sulfuricellaceae bacterium]
MWTWAWNNSIPYQIGTGFTAIKAGYSHALALKADGSLWTWGSNRTGELGDGSPVSNYSYLASPAQIGTGFTSIGAGTQTSFAVKADGSVWAWGANGYGQLGDGTTVEWHVPTPINFSLFTADVTSPTVPAALTATASGPSQINLAWTASTDNTAVVAYQVYRNGLLQTTLGNVTNYSDTGLTSSTLYSYSVAACDAANNCSAQSAVATATTAAAVSDTIAPTVPTGLSVVVSGSSQINLAWTASTDNIAVTAYQVYRNGALRTTLGNVTSYSDTGLTGATLYSYTVTACDAANNCSVQSTAASATTSAATATLSALSLACPATLASSASAACTANASYSDNSSKAVSAAWSSSNTAVAAVSASGQVTAASVSVDTPVTISASYSENGVSKTANAIVTITAAVAQANNACSGSGKYLTGISIAGGAAKKAGDTLDVNYCLKNFSKVSRFDIYVAVQLPDTSLLYLKSTGFFGTPVFTTSITPYLKNTLIPDLAGPVLSIPELPLELPLGSYVFYAVPVLTGKSVQNNANWIGQISQGTFSLSW